MTHSQQRHSIGPEALFEGGGSSVVTKQISVYSNDTEFTERVITQLIVPCHGQEVDLCSQTRGMCGDDPGPADEALCVDRGDDDGRILLRHAQWLAGNVFVDNEITDDADSKRAELLNPGEDILVLDPVPHEVFGRDAANAPLLIYQVPAD